MKKFFRILGKVIIILILLLILAYIIVGFFVLPHIITKTIPKKVSNENATLSIQKASFNPLTLRINVKNINLRSKEKSAQINDLKLEDLKEKNINPNDYGDIFSLDEFNAKLSPLSLLKKTIKVEHINIIKPKANIYKDANGKLNLLALSSDEDKDDEKIDKKDENASKQDDEKIKDDKSKDEKQNLEIKLPVNIILQEANIIDGDITFTDLSLAKPFKAVIDNINYQILGINLDKNNAGKHEFGADSNLLKAISWDSKVEINPIKAYGTFVINELDLHEVAKSIQTSLDQDINSAKLNARINYYIEIDKNKNIFKLENSHFSLNDIDIYDKENKLSLKAKNIEFPQIDVNAFLDKEQNASINLARIQINDLSFNDENISANFDNFYIDSILSQAKIEDEKINAISSINNLNLAKLNFSDKDMKASLQNLALASLQSKLEKDKDDINITSNLDNFALNNITFNDKDMKANLNDFSLNDLQALAFINNEDINASLTLAKIDLNATNFSDKTMQANNDNLVINNLLAKLNKNKDDINLKANLANITLNENSFKDKDIKANLANFSLNNINLLLDKIKDDIFLTSNISTLALNNIVFSDKDMKANLANFSLNNIDTALEQKQDLTSIFSQLGQINLNDINFSDKQMQAKLANITLTSLNNDVKLAKNSLDLTSNLSDITLNNLAFKDNIFKANNNLVKLSNINAKVKQNKNALEIDANLGKLLTNQSSLLVLDQKFLDLASINLTNASYIDNKNSNLAKLANANINNLKTYVNNSSFANFNALNLNQVNFDIKKNYLNANSITLDGLKAFISFINDKIVELENLPDFEDKSKKQAPKAPAKQATKTASNKQAQKPKSPEFSFDINKIGLSNSSITLKDDFSGKIVQNNITNINVLVEKISSNFAKAFNVNASLNLDPKSKISSKGNIQIEPLNLNLNSNVNIANLGIFSYYIQKFANLDVKSGSLNLTSQAKYGKNMDVKADLALANLNIFDTLNKQTLATLGNLKVTKLALNDKSASIDTINIASPFFSAIKNKDGKFNFESILKEEKKDDNKTQKKEEKKDEFELAIKQISLTNGAASFSDNSLSSMPFTTNITALKADINNIAKNKLSDIKLNALIDKYAMLDVKAKTYVFDFKKLTNLNLIVKSLNLSNFTPFTQEFIGYNITNGKLNIRADYKINDSKISANNYLNLDNVQMQENKTSKNITSIPINLALSLLKNRNNQIDFSVPVGGSLDDPNFKLFGTIMNTVGQIMTNIVLSPFRAVGNLVGLSNNDDDKGIDFEVGSTTFPPSEIAKFDYIKNKLAKNPNLSITINPTFNQTMDAYMLRRDKYAKELQAIATKQRLNKQAAMEVLAKQRKVSTKSSNLEGDLILSYKTNRNELLALANQRALSIKNELVKLGVNASKIKISSPSQALTTHKKFVLTTISAN